MARIAGVVAPLLCIAGALAAADTPFWVAPCDEAKASCKASDADLARWALAAWENASGGRVHFVETNDPSKALIRIVWAGPSGHFFGETVMIDVNERQGWRIMIYGAVGIRDALLHDAIVYLTCLHETGHVFGLEHSHQSADIMFPQRNISRSLYLGYGDIFEYFGRYVRKLSAGEDIRKNPGLSPADRQHLVEKLPAFEAR
jgi:hypothetical protein